MRRALAVLALAPALLQGQVQTFRLPSGLTCVLMEKHDQPLIRMELVTRWDPREEPPRKQGLAGVLATVLRAGGAGPFTRVEFNRALDDLGAQGTLTSRRDAFTWTLTMDSRSQEPAVELLAHAVFRPVFDAALAEAQGVLLARELTAAAPWERGEARFLWQLGDAATEFPPDAGDLKAILPADLESFARRVLRPEASVLAIQGDLNLTQARELVFLHFGLWGPGAQAPLAREGPDAVAPSRFTHVPDAGPDAELWAGSACAGCSPAVRELLGLLLEQVPAVVSPGLIATCCLAPGRPLLVKLKAGAGAREGLAEALRSTLARLRNPGFSAQDVDRARLRWKARLTALSLHPREQLSRCQEGVLEPGFQAKVDAVGPRDVQEALEAALAPGALSYLLLGGDAQLAEAAGQLVK